jgi:hypothetical protein
MPLALAGFIIFRLNQPVLPAVFYHSGSSESNQAATMSQTDSHFIIYLEKRTFAYLSAT